MQHEEINDHYNTNYSKLVSKASYILEDWQYGEDCVQESYENALRYSSSFKGGNYNAWFFSIFLNTVKKYLKFIKSQGVNQELKLRDHPLFPSELTDEHKGLIAEEIAKAAKKVKVKEMLLMYFVLGYRGKELEFLSGMSASSIHTQANRFKQFLMEKYEVLKNKGGEHSGHKKD
jgi:DNA-directed RNA polymerase specialized sigma24 family protein